MENCTPPKFSVISHFMDIPINFFENFSNYNLPLVSLGSWCHVDEGESLFIYVGKLQLFFSVYFHLFNLVFS